MPAMPDDNRVIALRPWLLAMRPKTLPAAVSPVLIGWAVAYRNGGFDWLPALVVLLCALLLQILANFINDVADYEKGTDQPGRLGPTRVTQSGLLSAKAVWRGVAAVSIVATLCGLYLAWYRGWPVLVIGAASLIFAALYTIGPYPLSDHGWGELFVFLFFGYVAVCGTCYVLTGCVPALAWLGGTGAGALITAILVVNNVRDLGSDSQAGRVNIPIRWGRRAGEIEYLILLGLAYLVPAIIILTGLTLAWMLLPYLSLPLAYFNYRKISTLPASPAFNQLLAATGQLTLAYALLFSLAVLMG